MGLGSFCTEMAGPLQVVGVVITILKIVIPVIIIVMGAIDLGKAVTAGKDDEIKKCMKSLTIRLISGVVLFFLPTLIFFVLGLFQDFNDATEGVGNFEACRDCILSPLSKCGSDAIAR